MMRGRMERLFFVSVILLLWLCGLPGQVLAILEEDNRPDEAKLKTELLEHYDPSVRPTYNTSHTTTVTADIALHQIIDVDEKQQLLQATVWMRLYWKDEFFTWDPEQYGGVSSLKLHPNKLWLPDICIYDALQPAVHANEMQDFYLSITHEGEVMWLSPLVIKSVCPFNVRYFPYDTQFCNMSIGSWMYHGLEIDLWNRSAQGDVSEFKNNVEWEVQSFKVHRNVKLYQCCPQPYPSLDFTLIIKRRPGFYVTYLYTPSVVIIVSSLFAFHLPPGSDAKVDLAVTGLLSQTVFLLLISDLMPPDAHNPPVLGQCLTILLVVQAAAVVVIVVVKRIHDDSIHKEKPPAKWLYKLMHYLKYPFLLHHIDYNGGMEKYHGKPIPRSVSVINRGFQAFDEQPDTPQQHSSPKSNGFNNKVANGPEVVCISVNGQSDSTADRNSDSDSGITVIKELCTEQSANASQSVMTLTLQTMLTEMKAKKKAKLHARKQDDIAQQWKHVAAMYDRILFIIFLTVIFGITIWFLTLHPTAESQRL